MTGDATTAPQGVGEPVESRAHQVKQLLVSENLRALIEPEALWRLRLSIAPTLGNCYLAALQVFEAMQGEKVALAHGAPIGQRGPALGLRYGHAWVEWNVCGVWAVVDFSSDKASVLDRRDYYRLGQVEGVAVARYFDRVKVLALLREHDHLGPWHPDAAPWVHADGTMEEVSTDA